MKTKIWSKRHSPARGNHWVLERECDCSPEDLQEWLRIFRKDEPNILFLASERKPSERKK